MDANPYKKLRVALYYYLLGAKHLRAARALTYGESLHTGLRKDGVTPEYAHQVEIASFVRTLPLPEGCMESALILSLLHDTPEDKDVGFEEIGRLFGAEAADLVDRLTKKFRGVEVPKETYFSRLAENPVSAVVKGADRLHNIGSMVGVFTREKQKRYIAETREWHLPMLKVARRNFPQFEPAFENIKLSLLSRIALIEAIHQAEEAVPLRATA